MPTSRPLSWLWDRSSSIRIWDVPCSVLSDRHLLGEHVELHTIWNAHESGLTAGYSRHPETLRWVGHLDALRLRHDEQAAQMARRGFKHRSALKPMDTSADSKDWPRTRLPGSIPEEAQDVPASGG